MILRFVLDEDIKPLAQLWFEGWQLGHADTAPRALCVLRTLDSFETRIRNNLTDCLVAGSPSVPIAFVRIKEAEIDQFYVAPQAMGKGNGARLMSATETWLLSRGVTNAHLYCAEKNVRAAGFYSAMGWTNCGVVQKDFETSAGPYPLSVIRFEKALSA